ncbi:MAG: hypothetical protein Ct9H300mP7_6400 [Verrucomicrobiota bacterium]|nr:MAG: hypothetical protein Ct9H300mP7_6400 [Verrucomicrobiota bacterium]
MRGTTFAELHRVDGHIGGLTPPFLAPTLAKYSTARARGFQVLAKEEKIARALGRSLNAKQRKVAVVDEKAPADIITKADRKARRLEPLGLAASEMNKKQFTQLWTLIEEYLRTTAPTWPKRG